MTRRPLLVALTTPFLLVGAFLLYGFLVPGVKPGIPIIESVMPTTCVVGLAGAAVSVEFSGPGAGAECDSLAGTITDGGTWYRYAGGTEPGGAVICQPQVGDVTATVRDQGMLNIYGTWLCDRLFQRAGNP